MTQRATTPRDATVVIAGLGPVGGLLAALLGMQGVRTLVVEPNASPYPKPRAAILDIEAIRVLAMIPGLPPLDTWGIPLGRNGVVGPDRRALVMLMHRAVAHGHPQMILLDQPVLEDGLRAALAAMPTVEIVGGRSVTDVEQTDDQVVAVLDDGSRIAAQWLVGCDGGASTVRTQAKIDFGGDTFAQPWLVVNGTTSDRDGTGVAGTTEPIPAIAFVLDPARPAVAMSSPGRWRWEWMLLPGEDPAAMIEPDAIRPLIAPWTDPDRLTIQRAAVFTFHARMAQQWRAGRVLLAGDAAHLMPPFAGAGLGMGFRDAIALGWRLGQVARGVSDDSLLDGYERDRRPDVAMMTRLALRIGRVVQTRNRAGSLMFRSVIRALRTIPGLQKRLGDRPLPPRRLPRGVAGPLAKAGHILPNPMVRVDGGPPVRLDEVIGYRWAYIGHGCDPRTVAGTDAPDAVHLAIGGDPGPGCHRLEDLDGLLTGRPGTVTAARPDRFLLGVLPPR
jgi:3-(3-hydroxy-phenyl)propionate hydroxylase